MFLHGQVKLQRNVGGAFPAHFDNAGPPSKRGLTLVLYLGCRPGGPLVGGDLILQPFLRRRARVRPRRNRCVLFRSDRVLHSVTRWRGPTPRYVASFWFRSADARLAAPEAGAPPPPRDFADYDALARHLASRGTGAQSRQKKPSAHAKET